MRFEIQSSSLGACCVMSERIAIRCPRRCDCSALAFIPNDDKTHIIQPIHRFLTIIEALKDNSRKIKAILILGTITKCSNSSVSNNSSNRNTTKRNVEEFQP